MPLRRAGTVSNAGVRYGPGSAAHHAVKNGALRCVRGTILRQGVRLPTHRVFPTLPATRNSAGRNAVTSLLPRRHVLSGAAALSSAALLPRLSYGADWRPTET